MKFIVTVAFVILIAGIEKVNAQLSELREFDDQSLTYFSTSSISPAPILTGRGGAMGSLQFTVRDSTRDIFINPAKYFGNQGLFLSPSTTHKSINTDSEFGGNTNPLTHSSQFSSYVIPVGAVYQTGSYYFGGLTGFTNFSSTQQNVQFINDGSPGVDHIGEEDVSGNPFEIVTGYQINERFSLAASYQRINYNRSVFNLNQINQISSETTMSQSMDHGNLGAALKLAGGQTYILAGLFTSKSVYDEMDSRGNYWQEMSGYILQIEHLHPVSATLSVGGILGYERRHFSDRTSETLYDEYTDQTGITQFGTGLHRLTTGSEFGLEVVYQSTNSEMFRKQPFNDPEGYSSDQQNIDSRRFIVRGGMDAEIWSFARLQAGISHTFFTARSHHAESNTNVPAEDISVREVRSGKLNYLNSTLLSSGFSCRINNIDLHYYFEVDFDAQFSNAARYRNQVLIQYRL